MQGVFNNPHRPPRQDFFYKVLAGSLIAHMVFFAFGLFVHSTGQKRTFFAPVYTVTLVEPRAVKKPAAVKKAPPKKAEKPRAKETVKVAKKPAAPAPPAAPAKKEIVSIERALEGIKERVEKKEEEEDVARRIEEMEKSRARESSAVERSIEELRKNIAAMAEAPPAPPAPPAAEQGAEEPPRPSGRVTMENLRAEHPEYYRAIRDRVWENWIYPMELRERDVEVIVAIKIGRSGELLDHRIEKSSGNRILDQSLVGAILKAAPFPPLPEGITGEYLDTGLRFCPGCAGE